MIKQKFNKIFQIVLKPIIVILSMLGISSCDASTASTTWSAEDKAIYDPKRPHADRKWDVKRQTLEVLKLLEIKPGMKIADLDAGNGYFSELFSSLVGPEGIVYLQNGNRYVTNQSHQIEARLKNGRLPNVVRIDSSFNNMRLPKNLDIIFSSLVYHDLYVEQQQSAWNADTSLYYPQLYKALKPGGLIIVIDHSAKEGTGIKAANSLHRISESYTIKAYESAGFRLIKSSDLLRNSKDNRESHIFKRDMYDTDQFISVFTK